MRRKLSAGWSSWVALVVEQQEAKEERQSSRSVMLHLANRKLSVGWNAWVAFASERLEALQLIRRGINFMASRKLAQALMSWLGAVDAEASNYSTLDPNPCQRAKPCRHSNQVNKRRKLTMTLTKMFKRQCLLALKAWNEKAMKEIGTNLHLFGGIEMQRGVFYTFLHCFPLVKDSNGGDLTYGIRGYTKDFFDIFWDGIGDWER